jgi:arylsulfatase A-like enzyme
MPSGGFGSRPHLIFIFQDDLGYADAAFSYRARGEQPPEVVALAGRHALTVALQEGAVLTRHYAHWHCSPSRRSFLSGRFIHHVAEVMETPQRDQLDLRMSTIGQKLQSVNYDCYWVGKGGGEGWRSMNSMAVNRGFGAGYYGSYNWRNGGYYPRSSGVQRWQNASPVGAANNSYSTTAFWSRALVFVENYPNESTHRRMFLYINPQAIHVPYTEEARPPPNKNSALNSSVPIRLHALEHSDMFLGRFVALMKRRGFWKNTLFVYSSDNGGCGGSSNYPLRGAKLTNWEGGVRVAAFVAGGMLSPSLHGRYLSQPIHVADWYPTFCYLAGVAASDGPALRHNTTRRSAAQKCLARNPYMRNCHGNYTRTYWDRYGSDLYPDIDGQNVWPLSASSAYQKHGYASQILGSLQGWEAAIVRATGRPVYLSENAYVLGQYKLVVSAPDPALAYSNDRLVDPISSSGWQSPPTWMEVNPAWRVRSGAFKPCEAPEFNFSGARIIQALKPCLFNVVDDPGETNDLASQLPDILEVMWALLNISNGDRFGHGVSPSLLKGRCGTCPNRLRPIECGCTEDSESDGRRE